MRGGGTLNKRERDIEKGNSTVRKRGGVTHRQLQLQSPFV